MRRGNIAACLGVLRDQGAATVTELARATGLSRPTVESIVAELGEHGLVGENDRSTAGERGRPARQYSFRATSRYVASVDIGLHTMTAAVADLSGRVHTTIRRPVPAGTEAVHRIAYARDIIRETLATADLSDYRLHTVVVAVPGIVDPQGRVVLSNPIPEWTGVNLAARFGEGLPCAVVVENDINMATLAEHRLGAAQFADDAVFVFLGHRINAGLILGGQLHRGHNYAAGEVADVAELGWRGWGERSAAGSAESEHDAAELLGRAAAGDDIAVAEVEEFAGRIAAGLATLSAALDPDIVVIGGGMSRAGDTLLEPLRSAVGRLIPGRIPPQLVASALGSDGVVLGGIIRALQVVSDRLYHAPDLPVPRVRTPDDEAVPLDIHTPEVKHVTDTEDTLRIGVVGLGARSKLALWAREPGMGGELVAVADPHPLARARAAENFGADLEVVKDYRELVDLGLDAAFVMSPDDTHAEIAVGLLEAGIAVYLEKPLATTIEDADRVLRAAYETGTKLYVGHNMRHMAVIKLMREVIARGEIGEVKALWCRHFVGNGGDYYFKDWHAEREHSTGLLLQKGAHDIDVMHWLAGSRTREVVGMGDLMIYGQVGDRVDHSAELMPEWFSYDNWPPLRQRGLNPVIDVEDLSMVLMRMDSGVLASYQQCHFTPDYWRNYTVIGTEGRCENFGDGDGGVVRVWNRRSDYNAEGDRVYPIQGDAYGHDDADALTVAEFLRFVRTGQPTTTSPLGARDAVAAGVAATTSLRDGSTPQRVPGVDPEVEEYFVNHQTSGAQPVTPGQPTAPR